MTRFYYIIFQKHVQHLFQREFIRYVSARTFCLFFFFSPLPIYISSVGHTHVPLGQYKFPDGRIVRESINATADREHYHGRRAVESVSRRDQASSRLEGCGLRHRGIPGLFGFLVNSEDRAHRDEAVDVGRAVERVEAHDVLAALLRLHLDGVLILLAHEHARGEGGRQHVDEELVAQNVQLLHFLALNVDIAGDAVPERIEMRRARLTAD